MNDGLKTLINFWLREKGFSRVRFLSPLPLWKSGELGQTGAVNPSGDQSGLTGQSGHCHTEFPSQVRSAVLVFFPYYRGDKPGIFGESQEVSETACLAPFARRNNYKECVSRLKEVSSLIRRETGMTKAQSRIFCNSRFPEKQMAWRCGLGFLGKNSLIMTPEYGSLGVIGGIFLPFDIPGDDPLEPEPYEQCVSCGRCSSACPAGALKGEGGIIKSLCYQYLSTSHEILSEPVMKKWGNILYGCQICQNVCPFNKNRSEGLKSELGVLGASLNPVTLLTSTAGEIKDLLRGSVPGASWIKPAVLKRNALLCLPRKEKYRELVVEYTRSKDFVLAGTADFVLKNILERE